MQSHFHFFIDDAVRALLDPRTPVVDPAVKTIQAEMSGFGYDFHDARNVAPANDELVRARAGNLLGEASSDLAKLERAYRERNAPGATRERPLPSPEVSHRIREIDAARKRCEALGTTFATAENPATDAIWIRFRNEESLLASLVAFDVELATGSIRARDAARDLEASAFDDGALAPLETELIALERAFSRRSALIKGGV